MNSKECILIVDDEESQRKTLSLILKKKGYLVDSAGTGKEALEIAGSRRINLALLDIHLPDTEGIELVAPLKQINPDMAIIMVTGFASVENTIRSLNAGASAYLVKPFNNDELLGKIQDLLQRQTLIREKRQAEEALEASKWKYRNLVETLQEGIWAIDKDAKTTFVNIHMAEMLGYSIEEMNGRPLFDFMDDQGRICAKQKIEHRKSGIKELHDFEFRKKDGSIMYASLETCPLSDKAGNYIGALAGVMDITERKHMEEILRESEARLQFLVSSTPVTIYTSRAFGDFSATYVSENVRENLGYEPDDFTMDSGFWKHHIHPDDVSHVFEELQHLFDHDYYVHEYRFRHKDGTWRWMHDESRLIRNTDRSPHEIIGYWVDITDRKETEEAIREVNQKLRLLTGLTRHDVFNQLNAVNLLHELALGEKDCKKITHYLSLAQEACIHIEKTIGFTREYEDFGTMSSGWQQMHKVIESAKKEVALGEVTMDNQIPVDLEVYSDPIIRKVFSTLIENAIRHGGYLLTIRISCYEIKSTLIITCEDDGIGIPTGEKQQIFDNGYGKHTGIGLFIAREILSITGISIRESGEPGKGARFEISVPRGKYRTID